VAQLSFPRAHLKGMARAFYWDQHSVKSRRLGRLAPVFDIDHVERPCVAFVTQATGGLPLEDAPASMPPFTLVLAAYNLVRADPSF
jgi:hypothetical protein